ncbi:MAG: sensor histidine kinase [Wujia sp.]
MNILSFAAFDHQAKHYNIEQENAALKNIIDMQLQQYHSNLKYSENIITLKHDMKNILIPLLSYAEQNDTDKIISSITKQLSILDDADIVSHSGCLLIDSIINFKASVAREHNIRIIPDIHIEAPLKIDDNDVCVLIGNALDNAIEYLTAYPTLDRGISTFIHCNQTALTITIKNHVAQPIPISDNTYIASTKTETGHGYGLVSTAKITEKYNGQLILTCENNIFTFGAVLFHIT